MTPKIVIIGSGPGGYVAALRASAVGADVTVIESEAPGGTCLNWGCIPSKIMKTTADLFLKFNEASEFGIRVDGTVQADMAALMARKKSILETQRNGILSLLKKSKARFIKGHGRINGFNTIVVTTNENEQLKVPYEKLIIATGTYPLEIPSFPFDGKTILSSNDLLSLNRLPQSMVIVGGGVIGCEFAFILSALGVDVTLVEAMPRLLPLASVDLSCSKLIGREMKKRKIKFYTDKTVEKIEKTGPSIAITLGRSPFSDSAQSSPAPQSVIEAETMAVCIGRSPCTKGLGLETIGLDTDEKGWIPVDNTMETTVKDIYAIGDILGPSKIMLAHVASHEGMVAADNCVGVKRTMDYTAVPGAIFTMPEIGNAGLTEAQALEQGLDIISTTVNFRNIGKAQVIGEIAGEAKIIAAKASGKLLGVHLSGPHATDLIAEGALAIKNGLTLAELAETIHAHPTLAEIMAEAALKGLGRPLHG